MTVLLAIVASMASFLGNRKFRPYPSATFTTSPRLPSLGTSSFRMTSMNDSVFSVSPVYPCVLCGKDFSQPQGTKRFTGDDLDLVCRNYCARPANGSNAILHACLMALD